MSRTKRSLEVEIPKSAVRCVKKTVFKKFVYFVAVLRQRLGTNSSKGRRGTCPSVSLASMTLKGTALRVYENIISAYVQVNMEC